MPHRELLSVRMSDAEITARDDDQVMHLSGWANTFHKVDSYCSMFAPNAFDASIADFRRHGVVCGLNHRWDQPIGVVTEAKTDPSKGLFVRSELVACGEDDRRRLTAKASNGRSVVTGLSIGFDIQEKAYFGGEKDVRAYWERMGYTPDQDDEDNLMEAFTPYCFQDGSVKVEVKPPGVRLITRAKLYEFSPVTFPGNWASRITEVRSRSGVIGANEPRPRDWRHDAVRANRDANLRARLALASLEI